MSLALLNPTENGPSIPDSEWPSIPDSEWPFIPDSNNYNASIVQRNLERPRDIARSFADPKINMEDYADDQYQFNSPNFF